MNVSRVMILPRALKNALVIGSAIGILDFRLRTRGLSIESPPFLRPASYLVIITTALDIPAWCRIFATLQDNAFLNICISVAHD